MSDKGRPSFVVKESVEDKIRKYTQPHPVVTSHLRNNATNLLYRSNVFHTTPTPFSYPLHLQLFPQNYPLLGNHFKNISPNEGEKRSVVFNNCSPIKSKINANRKRSHSSSTKSSHQELYGKLPRKHLPEDPNTVEKYLQLTEQVESYTAKYSQSTEILDKKLKLRSALLSVIRNQFPDVSLHLVGSSCNGFASDSSDADFCIMISQMRKIDQSYEARYYLNAIKSLIQTMGSLKSMQLIRAKVPILKFKDIISGCDCDINVNNTVGIRNTHLLRTYSKVDNRVQPLVMAIKRWGKARKINDASQGTLSSYSLVLMIIHYLQSACNPPVLPALQQRYPQYFQMNSNVEDLPMSEPANTIPCNNSSNKESVGQLLEGFFRYFAEIFLWDMKVMSVRLGSTILKENQLEFKYKYISIEEPFDLSNTARAVHELPQFVLIKKEFRRANERLKEKLSMDNIT